jgi:O-antigen/teichoic acid export membrane protein
LAAYTVGLYEIGLLNIGYQWFLLLTFLPNVLGQVLNPVINERLGEKDITTSLQLLKHGVWMSATLASIPAGIVIVMSPWLAKLYGPDFENGWAAIAVMSGAAVFAAMASPLGVYLAAVGHVWIALAMNLAWAIVLLSLELLLLKWGAVGAATAFLLAYCAHLIWVVAFSRFWLFKAIQKSQQC